MIANCIIEGVRYIQKGNFHDLVKRQHYHAANMIIYL